MTRGRTILAALFAAAVVATACGGAGTGGTGATTAARPAVIVGSTNFYEQITLGELYAQILEANGYKVTRKFNLGNREIVYPAIKSAQIDVVAEYLATLLVFVDKDGKIAKPTTDKTQTAAGLQKALDADGLTVLDPADATDQNGFVVTKDTASSKSLKKLSDLAPVAKDMILGGPPECPQRPFCLLGLKNVYGLSFKDFKPLDAGGPLTVAALEGKQIDVGLLFTSDPSIVAKNFVLLDDDKHLQLADNIAPVVRKDLVSKDDGTLKRLLSSISAKLTQAELNDMNKQVAVDKKDNKDVAAAWLKKQGLIK
ncbi:MAG TPA: ABC transporter substrate-binding protein [Candidatus Limnocylindria bacterium]|jgi:osmoprotectant transport system substrate-binding protein|nr:ABC transporter substrate-binding protein [Candidatus Limnocylindria bacterium]